MENATPEKPLNVYSGIGSVERSRQILKESPLAGADKQEQTEEKKISPFSIVGSIERAKKFLAQEAQPQEAVAS